MYITRQCRELSKYNTHGAASDPLHWLGGKAVLAHWGYPSPPPSPPPPPLTTSAAYGTAEGSRGVNSC